MFLSTLVSSFLMFSPSAHAIEAVSATSEVSFSILEDAGLSGQIYYTCDSLQDMTEAMLKKLGASDIRVYCTGGLENGHYWGPASIDASFSHAVKGSGQSSRDAGYKAVVVRGSDGCHAAQQIFAGISRKLDLTGISGTTSSCSPKVPYNIKASALMFN